MAASSHILLNSESSDCVLRDVPLREVPVSEVPLKGVPTGVEMLEELEAEPKAETGEGVELGVDPKSEE